MLQRTLLVAAVASFAFASVACTVSPVGQDLMTAPSGTTPNPSPDPVPPCAAIAAACAPSEIQYATVTDCTSAGEERCRLVQGTCGGSSFYCGSTENQCTAYPSCDAGDEQVTTCGTGDTCYQRTLCGSTVTCREPRVDCKALPICDAGDIQVTDVGQCQEQDCYFRTTCGTTIWCVNVN